MKSQKGITLTSLAIYIVIVIIILGILLVISGNFQSNIKEINKEGTNNSEIDKFNLSFLKEVNKQGNQISTISENEVLFTLGNKYTFEKDNNCIYLNDNIKVAENIEICQFFKIEENEKIIILVNIKAINGKEKNIQYVLNTQDYAKTYENEKDYVYTSNDTDSNTLNDI